MTIKRTRLKSTLPRTVTIGQPQPKPALPGGASEADRRTRPAPTTKPPLPESVVRARAATRTVATKRRIRRRVTPLEVLQQPIQAGVRKVFDWRRMLAVLGLTALVLLLPTPPGLSLAGHRALALFVFTGAILALEPAPLPIAALLVPVAQIALGIAQVGTAFAPFGNKVLFLILGSLFLAEALRKHGLTRRMALYAIVRSQGDFTKLLLGLILMTGALSMFVLNTATAAVLIPVAITIAQQVKQSEENRKALKVLILAIGYSASIGAMATIMGSGENAIASGTLSQLQPFGFLDWMRYGLPLVALLLPVTWFILPRVFRLPRLSIDTEPAQRELERLGRLNGPQRETVAVLVGAVFLWISGSSLEKMLHLPPTLLSSTVVAIGAVALLSLEEVVNWNDLRGVNWGVFFVIGAGLTLGNALTTTGAGEWFAQMVAPILQGLPYAVVLTLLVLLAFTLTQFMNNVTLGSILAPILVTVAQASGLDPVRILLPTIMTLALAFATPGASARMTLVAVTGAVTPKDMARGGFLVGLPGAALIWIFFYVMSSLGWI